MPKEMFDPYNADDAPASMPFPDSEELAIPAIHRYQRSWIHDVGLRDSNIASVEDKKELNALCDKIKTDALASEAFSHVVQPGDAAEEARIPELVTQWKQKHRDSKAKRKGKNATDEDEDVEVDDSARSSDRATLLRGYTHTAWRLAIQKVISNKRNAERTRLGLSKKHKAARAQSSTAQASATPASSTQPSGTDARVLQKLLGLTEYTGRDKFRADRHDAIREYSQTLTAKNPGGQFHRAEALLWEQEDHAAWNTAAAAEGVDENVDWVARQQLVGGGLKHLITKLHGTGKFRPFVATMLMAWVNTDGKIQMEWQVYFPSFPTHAEIRNRTEAIPDQMEGRFGKAFENQFKDVVKNTADAMHSWAEKPLVEYHRATCEDSATGGPPVFPLSMDALAHTAPNALAQSVAAFVAESYRAAFGNEEIPWAMVAEEPAKFYDAERIPIEFTSAGLANFSFPQWYDLASKLTVDAGTGFFRKLQPVDRDSIPPLPPPPPQRCLDHESTAPPPPRLEAPVDRHTTPPPRQVSVERDTTTPPPRHDSPANRDTTPPLPPLEVREEEEREEEEEEAEEAEEEEEEEARREKRKRRVSSGVGRVVPRVTRRTTRSSRADAVAPRVTRGTKRALEAPSKSRRGTDRSGSGAAPAAKRARSSGTDLDFDAGLKFRSQLKFWPETQVLIGELKMWELKMRDIKTQVPKNSIAGMASPKRTTSHTELVREMGSTIVILWCKTPTSAPAKFTVHAPHLPHFRPSDCDAMSIFTGLSSHELKAYCVCEEGYWVGTSIPLSGLKPNSTILLGPAALNGETCVYDTAGTAIKRTRADESESMPEAKKVKIETNDNLNNASMLVSTQEVIEIFDSSDEDKESPSPQAPPTKPDGRVPFPPAFTIDVASRFDEFRQLQCPSSHHGSTFGSKQNKILKL
ncbi:hypothetical protein GGX14DRAFT_386972 [Mycena pura]|uniref:Uncharacterized protein n=1 Tax=Mycena pura TaxID=153505 RepID=A0AAD7E1V9_9AGAR|nr:hypothetical protein GGX14DRAFT_386972 [Mycena pura]